MKSKTPLYKLAPVTASTAKFLAIVYGASSIEDYAQSLPRSARILDVGAGNSELGRVVAGLRPDVSWTNLDINYTSPELSRLQRDAPENLKYINGNVLDSHELPDDTYDRIYAFWVLPHIGIEDPKLIGLAITNMLGMLKNSTSSRLVVGPLVNKRTGSASTNYLTTELIKNAGKEDVAGLVTDSTVPKDQIGFYRAMNRAGLMTLKNEQRTGQKPTRLGLWDFKTRQYVKALSVRGFLLLARFRLYLVMEKIRSEKS